MWIGSPLLVHGRCQKAIFDISQNAVLMMPSLSSPNQIVQTVQRGIYKNMEYTADIEFEYHFKFGSDIVMYSYSKKDSNFILREKLIVNNKGN